jgi:hypothetical protein
VCCQVEVSATSWSLVQRNPTDCGVSLCDLENLKNEEAMTRVGPQRHRKGEKMQTPRKNRLQLR